MRSGFVKAAAVLLALVCLGAAAVFGYKIYDTKKQDRESDEIYEQILNQAEKEADKDILNIDLQKNEEFLNIDLQKNEGFLNIDLQKSYVLPEDFPKVSMDALRSYSSDIVGWLSCPGTKINYPLVQGSDNRYYLGHLADGTENRNGCLFMDCESATDLTDENTIIYGHHMQSGAMFASLVNYADQDYYEAHPYFYLLADGVPYRIDLFSGYDAAVSDDAYCRTFSKNQTYAAWLRKVAERSDFKTDMTLSAKDRTITLSTCAYCFDNARYVLHGRLVRLERMEE